MNAEVGGGQIVVNQTNVLVEKKKSYTFITDSGARQTFDDPDAAICWSVQEVPDESIVEIVVEEVD